MARPTQRTSLFKGASWAIVFLLPAFGVQSSAVFTSLHSFQLLTNGANPFGGLVQGSDGCFYGTTYFGGTNGGSGTVFKITTNGTLTTLHSFTGVNDGWSPNASLVERSDGYFYGTTRQADRYGGHGTLFKISTNGVFTNLYTFTGGSVVTAAGATFNTAVSVTNGPRRFYRVAQLP